MVEDAIRPGTTVTVESNYDQVIKYATAIKDGTAATEAVMSRFTRSAIHPAYQAMLEIGARRAPAGADRAAHARRR